MAEAALPATATGADRVAGSSKALLVVDDECICVEASLGACRMFGLARGEVVGRGVDCLLEPESQRRFGQAWRALRGAGGDAGTFALELPGAPEVAISVTAAILPSRHLVSLEAIEPVTGERGTDGKAAAGGRRFAPLEPPARRSPTAREREVLELLAGGRTDGQIAELLELSPATVQTHVRNAKAKLGARTRAQAVAIALQTGLIGSV